MNSSNTDSNVIGYILKGYPRTSETFITNEIRLLEKQGLDLSIFSVKKLEGQKNHAMVKSIQAPVTYLPQASALSDRRFSRWIVENVPKFVSSHLRLIKKRPMAYGRAFLECLYMSFKYRTGPLEPPREVFFKEFLQAGYIADQVLEAGNIRHLHAHFCHGSTTIAMFSSRMSGIPFSFTAHAKDIYLKELNPGNLLQKKMRRAKFLVTCTGANVEHLQKIAPPGTEIHKIYHGLDTNLFDAKIESSELQENSIPVILSVGRLVEKKGFPYLIEACKLLKDRGANFHCQIVGGGDDDYMKKIEGMINLLGLKENISLTGAVTQEELREIFRQATVFALPCQIVANGDRDGIPNVLVEAMSMQVPVVSTNISGIPELIEHDVNGFLVPEKNPFLMADALEILLLDPALRQRFAQAGRERICQHFDSERTTRVLRDIFLEQIVNYQSNEVPKKSYASMQ